MIGYGNSMFLATHGILARSASGAAVDPDAQAFITAASITDPIQQSAINQLVVDLKGYNIWTKMKALYPFVGGTAAQHKWNLKDPRDLDVAFRLVFSGGWTHSANGALPNGTNAYADTKFATTGNIAQNSGSMGVYSRTNTATTGAHGSRPLTNTNLFELFERWTDNNFYCYLNDSGGFSGSNTDSRGFNQGSRTASNAIRYNRNTTTNTGTTASTGTNTLNIWIGASNQNNSGTYWNNREIAFYYIGDGLSNTEMQNYYTAVQAYQTTLGRSIGTQTVSDADAQAFVTNAGIVDQVEANAINNLVIGLKADSLWTKMKAIYPFVGGTATTNKFNLKNPLDTDAAFRLVFSGGWTHSSNGILGNGLNVSADTFLIPSTAQSINSKHFSVYSRTNSTNGTEFASLTGGSSYPADSFFIYHNSLGANSTYVQFNDGIFNDLTNVVNFNNQTGFYVTTRTSSTQKKLYRNGSNIASFTRTSTSQPNASVKIGNFAGSYYTSRQYAFMSIGDGLDDTDATNLNSRVTTFQTALNRNV